ncbi:MAG: flagellar protein FliS [Lachnospiraceae bacterium]|jgi:flagellar protein FliS|nr:flagellar protein FliS [Lachnospiraceae bacterium]
MNKEKKQEFTARVVNANRSELIVIMYDLIFTYMEDARADYAKDDWEATKVDFAHMEMVIRRLVRDLNHTYKVADELYALYQFCLRQLALCKVRKNLEGMEHAKVVLDNLYVGMKGMAKEDASSPMMRNSQQVVAGLTYGKSSISEVQLGDTNRGFYA